MSIGFFLYFLLISPILTAYDGFPTQPKSQNIIISISKENFEKKEVWHWPDSNQCLFGDIVFQPNFFFTTLRKNYNKKQVGNPLVSTVKLKIVLTTLGHFASESLDIIIV